MVIHSLRHAAYSNNGSRNMDGKIEQSVELAVKDVSVAYNNGHVALYDASFSFL